MGKLTRCGLWSQDRPKAVLQLELAEKEADRLRVTLEEKENNHNQIRAEAEQQLQHWALDLQAECHNLYLLLVQSGANHTSVKFPPWYYFTFWLT